MKLPSQCRDLTLGGKQGSYNRRKQCQEDEGGSHACFSRERAGMLTSGSVQPVALITAGSDDVQGDLNGNAVLDTDDVRLLLETIQGYREAGIDDLIADFNGDGKLTIDDAIRALHIIASR